MEKMWLKIAAQFAAQALAEYREYEERCEQDNREGHRAHYCEHGLNMWTDYDNICGYCEEGYTMSDSQFRYAWALEQARGRKERFDKVCEAYESMCAMFPNREPQALRFMTDEMLRMITV